MRVQKPAPQGRQKEQQKKRSTGPTGYQRRLPVGAEVVAEGGVHFRVWAPASERVWIQLSRQPNRQFHALGGNGDRVSQTVKAARRKGSVAAEIQPQYANCEQEVELKPEKD